MANSDRPNHRKRLVSKRQETFPDHDHAPLNNFLTDQIPEDLLTEILIRLPDRKNLIRCAATCKRLLALTGEPLFYQEFTRRHGDELALVFQTRTRRWCSGLKISQIFPHGVESCGIPTFLPWRRDVVVRACFDDLLLISCPGTDEYPCHDRDRPLTLYICNPVSKKWRSLEPPPLGILKVQRCGLVCYGHRNSQFRVVVLCETTAYGEGRDRTWVTVFSSETWKWSPCAVLELPDSLERCVGVGTENRPFDGAVPLNGYLYWLGGHTADRNRQVVFCMNPFAAATPRLGRCWQLIRLPQNSDASFQRFPMSHLRIGACNGKLRLGCICYVASRGEHILRVWELLDQKGEGSDDHPNSDVDSEEDEDEEFYYSSSHHWSLVYDEALGDGFGRGTDASMLAFHPTDPGVVFVQRNKEHAFRYDVVRRRGVRLSNYPAAQLYVTGSQVSTHALCVRTLWPSLIK